MTDPSSTTLSIHALPRPFKSAAPPSRTRTRSLKQILQAERDAALRASGAKMRERKPKPPAGATGKARLVGAARRAAERRVERERRERGVVLEEAQVEAEVERQEEGEGEVPGKAEVQEKAEVLEKGEEGKKEDGTSGPKRKREVPTYASVEAPPSLRPSKKYCDITGLLAPYTDPKSRLRYHSVEVYELIKQFGPGVDNAYLALRGDASEIK